jgi:dienelactone hydrolase
MLHHPAEPTLGFTSALLTDQERKLLVSLIPQWQAFAKSYLESAKSALDLRPYLGVRNKITKILKPPSFGIRFDELEETLSHWNEGSSLPEPEKPLDALEASCKKWIEQRQSRNQNVDGELFLFQIAQQHKSVVPEAAACIFRILSDALSPTSSGAVPFYQQEEKYSIEIRYFCYLSGNFPIYGFLAKPQGTGPFPIVLIGHHGFWGLTPFSVVSALRLAQQGFLAFAPEFRGQGLSHGVPEIAEGEVDDMLSALAYLREKEGGDAQRLFFLGEGHGAMVAFLAASRTRAQNTILLPFIPDLIAFWSALQKSKDRSYTWQLVSLFLFCGGSPDQFPTNYRKRSPVQYLDRLQSPLLFLLGDSDPILPATKLLDLIRELKSFQAPYKLVLYNKGDHNLHLGTHGQDIWETILRALKTA